MIEVFLWTICMHVKGGPIQYTAGRNLRGRASKRLRAHGSPMAFPTASTAAGYPRRFERAVSQQFNKLELKHKTAVSFGPSIYSQTNLLC